MGALNNAGGVYLLTLGALALLAWAFLSLTDRIRELDQLERAKKKPLGCGYTTKGSTMAKATMRTKILYHSKTRIARG